MAKFTIYSPSGTALYEGTPTFSGSFMEPGQLTFRNVAVPYALPFLVGSYVDYSLEDGNMETRTGFRYKLYTMPSVTKQARQAKVGDALVYDSVTFYDATKMLEFCPFRDIVTNDNKFHYSTQASWSTYEDVEGIRKRIQENIDAMYPDEHWVVVLATRSQVYDFYSEFMGKSAAESSDLADEYQALVSEAREFSFSGGSVLDALKRIYEVWKEIGWTYGTTVGTGGVLQNVITIAPAGVYFTSLAPYLYGKGNGLKSLKRSVANEGELCNRIYPLGNSTNVSRDWYRKQLFLGHSSADIQHLMLPISDWGLVPDGGVYVKSPTMAFLEDAASILRNGLRPKYVYFDGSNDLDDIYPTIKEITVGDIREYIEGGGTVDYAPGTLYADSDRIDEVISVQPDASDSSVQGFDSGVTGDDDKVSVGETSNHISSTHSVSPASQRIRETYEITSYVVSTPQGGDMDLSIDLTGLKVGLHSSVALRERPTKNFIVQILYTDSASQSQIIDIPFEMDMVSSDAKEIWFQGSSGELHINKHLIGVVDEVEIAFACDVDVYTVGTGATAYMFFDWQAVVQLKRPLTKDFLIRSAPFGFNLKDLVATEGQVSVKMTSGACAGREFVVTNCVINAYGGLITTLQRQYDESLGQYFPNTNYIIDADDNFVILGISMPDFYMKAAEKRLKAAAQKYLATYSREIWQYSPEVDPKFMVENKRRLMPGQYMRLIDPDIIAEEDEDGKVYLVDATSDVESTPKELRYVLTSRDQYILLNDGTSGVAAYVVIDSINIDESGALPSWRVTLRNRKRVPKYEIVKADVIQLGRKQGDLIIRR